jgi:hypothetical protein
MININILSYDRDPYARKVVYDHTHIASYRIWCVGNVGKRVGLLALDGRNADLAKGFPSNPFLSGPRQTHTKPENPPNRPRPSKIKT